MSAMVLQLHGFGPATLARDPSAHPHRVLRFGSICAIVSRCPHGGEFDDLSAEETAERVMLHHEILVKYCQNAPVLPTRFGAFFSSISEIRSRLESGIEHHLKALDLLADKKEFAVKLTLNSSTTGISQIAQTPVTTGSAFLERRKMVRDARTQNSQERVAFSATLAKALNDLAPATTYQAGDTILHVGLLLPNDLRGQLQEVLNYHGPQADRLGLSLQATGPWPPYGFDAERMGGVLTDGH